jgi:hypothetical protein
MPFLYDYGALTTLEPNFKLANEATAHNYFHLFCDGKDGARSYHGSYMTLRRTQSTADTLLNPAAYDRKGTWLSCRPRQPSIMKTRPSSIRKPESRL